MLEMWETDFMTLLAVWFKGEVVEKESMTGKAEEGSILSQ